MAGGPKFTMVGGESELSAGAMAGVPAARPELIEAAIETSALGITAGALQALFPSVSRVLEKSPLVWQESCLQGLRICLRLVRMEGEAYEKQRHRQHHH